MAILGIDEVGRGPFAGPLVVGAVVLGEFEKEYWGELTDSKKLTEKKREELSKIILAEAAAVGLGWVFAEELDRIGLSEALKLATRRAVKKVLALKVSFSEVVIDGTVNFLGGTPLEERVSVLKKADLLIKEVSAASIVAKVARDNYMKEVAKEYPEYGFEKNVGYGTAGHLAALKEYGVCPEHRRSFRPIKKILGDSSEDDKQNDGNKALTTTDLGVRAEGRIADYLIEDGHTILARNQKTKFYEIDIISIKDSEIYFTEVKYRKKQGRGTSLEQITPKKQEQMRFAAEAFLKFQPYFKKFNPHLAVAAVSGEDFKIDAWFPIGFN